MNDALKRMLQSMKFWTLILGGVTTAGASMFAKWALDVSDDAVMQIAITISGLFAVLLHAQGQTDLGKNATPTTNVAAGADVTINQTPAEPLPADPQKGSIRINALLMLSAFTASLAIGSAWSCSSMKGEGGALGAIVDCTTKSTKALSAQFAPLVDALLVRATDSTTGKVDWSPIKSATKSFAADTGGCVLAAVVQRYLHPAPPDPNAPQTEPLKVDLDSLRAGFNETRSDLGGKTYLTSEGSL